MTNPDLDVEAMRARLDALEEILVKLGKTLEFIAEIMAPQLREENHRELINRARGAGLLERWK